MRLILFLLYLLNSSVCLADTQTVTTYDSNAAHYLDGTGAWTTPSSSSQWTTANTNDVYLPNNGNVGLGTTFTTTGALVIMNGNVGIGTWKPGNIFQVGTGLPSGGNSFSINSGTALGKDGSASVPGFTFGADSDNGMYRNGTNTLAFATAGLNAVHINPSQNVGIGSINPGTLLDIQGNIRINGVGAGLFRIQAAANQSCATTCTTGRALVGLDQGTLGAVLPSLVGPTDATADQCLCGS